MTDIYTDAVRALAGHRNFQRFERWSVTLARREWPGAIVTKVSDTGKQRVDLHVQRPKQRYLTAIIECKATSVIIDTEKAMEAFWKRYERSLKARARTVRAKIDSKTAHILATTALVDDGLWEAVSEKLGIERWELWDANRLAARAADDAVLTTLLPGDLPGKLPHLRTTLVSLIAEHADYFGIPVRTVLQERVTERISAPSVESHELIVGPPNVGKTCWAFQAAADWERSAGAGSRTAFLVNTSRITAELVRDATQIALPGDSILIVFDDIHFQQENAENWIASALGGLARRKGITKTVWIARNLGVAERIKSGLAGAGFTRPLESRNFGLEKVLELYLERLDNFPLWQRLLLALEAGLDPRLGHDLQISESAVRGAPTRSRIEGLESWLRSNLRNRSGQHLTQVDRMAGSRNSYHAYLRMLPFGTLNFPLHVRTLEAIGVGSIVDVEHLVEAGWCAYAGERGQRRVLTTHPIQARRILDDLESFPDRKVRMVGATGGGALGPLHERVFGRYLRERHKSGELESAVTQLQHHAEWAGVRGPLADGLGALLSDKAFAMGTAGRATLERAWLKLRRTTFPADDLFVDDLNVAKQRWVDRLVEIEPGGLVAGNDRKDHILYEIGYIDLLVGNYAEAESRFAESVEAACRLVATGMTDRSLRKAAANALSNVWVSQLCLDQARAQQWLADRLAGRPRRDKPCAVAARRAAVIHRELVRIVEHLRAKRVASRALWRHFEAALDVLDAPWESPRSGTAYRADDLATAAVGWLRRHEYNAWAHAIRSASWPKLYGVGRSSSLPSEFAAPPHGYRAPEWMPQDVEPSSFYYTEYVHTLEQWMRGRVPKGRGRNAAYQFLALQRRTEHYENLSDQVLLAWHLSDQKQAQKYLAWYLRHRVPRVGGNELGVLAIRNLEKAGRH